MTDQPTDHRAEAEKWLHLAEQADIGGHVSECNALISISHWLGELVDEAAIRNEHLRQIATHLGKS